ncbi:MAG: hypothetical protein M3Z85_18055, partial [Acidobacteriota bacterium]|nr:hypothetical protein [Acidobacteriota bacterium]
MEPTLEPTPGSTLGHFQILSKIGQGGMGVVYKGVDTRLNRAVAIKFIAQEVAQEVSQRAPKA